jgi:hypothetical protein
VGEDEDVDGWCSWEEVYRASGCSTAYGD